MDWPAARPRSAAQQLPRVARRVALIVAPLAGRRWVRLRRTRHVAAVCTDRRTRRPSLIRSSVSSESHSLGAPSGPGLSGPPRCCPVGKLGFRFRAPKSHVFIEGHRMRCHQYRFRNQSREQRAAQHSKRVSHSFGFSAARFIRHLYQKDKTDWFEYHTEMRDPICATQQNRTRSVKTSESPSHFKPYRGRAWHTREALWSLPLNCLRRL